MNRFLLVVLICAAAVSFAACGDDDEGRGTATPTPGPLATPTANLGFCGGDLSDVEARIDDLLPRMTLTEKVAQMHGLGLVDGLWVTSGNEALGIPRFRMTDGPRGVGALTGKATAFPVAMARGATWNPELEERVGEAIGAEVATKGGNVLLAPTINILRHPRWGRAQETYGEDPLHMGDMGVAFIRGAQQHVVASAKHYAVNSIEDTRFTVDVSIDQRTLREIYLPHFRRAVQEANVGSVMSAYNLVNGLYCAENGPLLRDILEDEWGFLGFVESDWVFGTRSTVGSAIAGLDIEMPGPNFYGAPLVAAVQNGDVSEDTIDDAVRSILRVAFCFGLDREASAPDLDIVAGPAHGGLALEVARQGIVLLENRGDALPLRRDAIESVAVVGALADLPNIGDTGSSNVNPPYVVTPLQGILDHAGSVTVHSFANDTLTAEDEGAVAGSDAAIVVVGLTADDEGENLVGAGDRTTMSLSDEHRQLVARVASLNPRTIVVLEGGSAITMQGWHEEVAAILMAWYPGQEGGNAIAEVLFGDVNPAGRLPITFARAESDYPDFVNDSNAVTYDYYHGYRYLDRAGTEPLYPFGYGLSYTTFEYGGLELSKATLSADDTLRVGVDVTNTGSVAGVDIVQLYVGYDASGVERAPRDLKAFARVALEPGQTETVTLPLRARDLAYYDADTAAWVVEPASYSVEVGRSVRDLPLIAGFEIEATTLEGARN